MKRRFSYFALILAIAVTVLLGQPQAQAANRKGGSSVSGGRTSGVRIGAAQSLIVLAEPVTVAPQQPVVEPRSTVGIINALCDVTLDFLGCGFMPTAITIACDTNGDGVVEATIPLKHITIVSRLLLQATIPALENLPGSAFPLTCCGGIALITLSRTVTEGDDNAFGTFTQTQTCPIDLGLRAPVVVSLGPVSGNCSLPMTVLIPGSCFLLADGKPNVTSVFAVERNNVNNVIQAKHFTILNNNLIDSFFDFGPSSAGKSFLIFVSGPNGTSRNLTTRPPGVPTTCPIGNELGIIVTFTCAAPPAGDPGETPTDSLALVNSCSLARDSSGVYSLTIVGRNFRDGGTLTIGGVRPKKVKFKDAELGSNAFSRIVAKKKVCNGLPGAIIYTNADGSTSIPFFCAVQCLD
jgi:hypothetical protein